jgi:predicted DNA-binding protein (MmcQ/YjbR family)
MSLRKPLLSKPNAEECFPFDPDLPVYFAGRKMFAIFSQEDAVSWINPDYAGENWKWYSKADPHAQNRWRRYHYPNIKKKPAPKEPISFSKTRPASAKMPRSTKRAPFVGTSR